MKYRVIIEPGADNNLRSFEISAGMIIAEYFEHDVVFLRPIYLKTPDLLIHNELWELKSPLGNSKNTIHNIFKTARRQAKNVIIDLRRCKMREDVAMAKLTSIFTNRRKRDGRLLVIRKNGKVTYKVQHLCNTS